MNTHGVPEDKIKIMIENFEPFTTLDDIRNAQQNRRRNGGNKR